jgi:hypothetical protein
MVFCGAEMFYFSAIGFVALSKKLIFAISFWYY